LIHLILLLLYKPLAGISGLLSRDSAEAVMDEPLTFELTSPEEPSELVETPFDAQTAEPPSDARYLSDKNARAQDMYAGNDLPVGDAMSEGRSVYKTFAGEETTVPLQQDEAEELKADESDRPQENESTDLSSGDIMLSQNPRPKFSKELLQSAQAPKSPNTSFTDAQNWNNTESSAEALGGVSLSTYEWDYAPYLFYMKKRIRDHLYPPQAFIQMGAISGEVTIRFILHRDGTVHDLRFISNKGHKSFIEPSLNSIRASDPFKSLPTGFPDPYLELTWIFIFTVYR
jgi:outer membrane biosynthesis protein TonB